jgi:hypothetical protein
VTGQYAEEKSYGGTGQQDQTPLHNLGQIPGINTSVEQIRHEEGDGDIHNDLKNDKEDG